jgi:TetR/AcrR family transcriptional regulator, transcriptional repressor for nem operon
VLDLDEQAALRLGVEADGSRGSECLLELTESECWVNTETVDAESQVRGPGRPLSFDRRAALDHLVNLFWEHGYDQVNQQAMAAATGLSTSSLYNSFGTKPQIYREVLGRYLDILERVLEPLERGCRGRDDVLEALDRLESLLRSRAGRFGCLLVCSMTTVAGRDRWVAEIGERYRARLRAGFAAALQRGRTAGEQLPDPEVMAPVLTAAIIGTATIGRTTRAGPEALAQFDALRALVGGT